MIQLRRIGAFCAVAFLAAAWTGCSNVPDECDPEGPLESAACGDALARLCAELTTEEDCNGSEAIRFDDSGDDFYCAWAGVVVVGDEQACTITSASRRCVAVVDDAGSEDSCNPVCEGGGTKSDLVVLETGELMAVPCGRSGGHATGPVDGTLSNLDDLSFLPCGNPNAPPSCDCAAQACEAL